MMRFDADDNRAGGELGSGDNSRKPCRRDGCWRGAVA